VFIYENDKKNDHNGDNVVVTSYDNHNNLEEIIAAIKKRERDEKL